jgi:hypothetical protein
LDKRRIFLIRKLFHFSYRPYYFCHCAARGEIVHGATRVDTPLNIQPREFPESEELPKGVRTVKFSDHKLMVDFKFNVEAPKTLLHYEVN